MRYSNYALKDQGRTGNRKSCKTEAHGTTHSPCAFPCPWRNKMFDMYRFGNTTFEAKWTFFADGKTATLGIFNNTFQCFQSKGRFIVMKVPDFNAFFCVVVSYNPRDNPVKMFFHDGGKTANSCLPDIHAFDAKHEINQIPPVLWNFLYRLSTTDKEDKEFVKTVASWDHHYIETPFNVNRAFPRLYMCSCIFNCQNAQCVQPLHLLVTDICDKFSNASSTFLSINARLGLGVSKDSLRRYITNRCRQLEQQQRFLTSNSFVVASFDNLDKNQSYSVVGVGKDKSGFQGTTIQAVTPCPSLLTSISSSESCGTDLDDSAVPLLVNGISSEANIITSDIKSSSCEVDLISSAVAIVDKVSTCTALSRDRSLTCDFIQSIVNPDDKIEPS
ncbi:unnamed protein product [Mytilus edulis]|uniref:Uncharacterized protein n=1 Tax=Mytilus edulis TaxID=6550 RepID=A0A8S3TM65_MYTED|nr:unnamed protein product [Mytilus edulis]